jgi:hypothetical protein
VAAIGFVRQIALRDLEMTRLQDCGGKDLDQKLSFDFPGRNVVAPAGCHFTW